MATYTYKCDECKQYYDVEHGMTETPTIVCMNCGQPTRKTITRGTTVIYKGDGFASTVIPRKSGIDD